jgi:hypothetical protein
MIAIIFGLEDFATFQLISFFIMNSAYLIYVISYKPLHEQWHFEIFNESTTLLLTALTFIFTDFVDNPTIKYYFGGYSFILLLSINISINLLSILISCTVSTFKQVRWKIRIFLYNRRTLKESPA